METETFEIQVLRAFNLDDNDETLDTIPDYGLEEKHILIKQVISAGYNLKTSFKEENIRPKIVLAYSAYQA